MDALSFDNDLVQEGRDQAICVYTVIPIKVHIVFFYVLGTHGDGHDFMHILK